MFSLLKTAAEAIAIVLCVLIVAAFINPTCSLKRPYPQHAFILRLSGRLHNRHENERSHP